MKLAALLALGLCCALCTAGADLTIVQKIEGAGPIGEVTMKIKGDVARVEATPGMATLVDAKTGDVTTLMYGRKRFVRMSAERVKAMAQMATQFSSKQEAASEKPKLVPTGKKETINGYETEEYRFETPAVKGSFWIATNFPDAAAVLKQMHALESTALKMANTAMPDYSDLPGLPIRSNVTTQGREIKTTISSIKQDPLPDGDFAVPKDFTAMDIPDIFGGKAAGAPKEKKP